MVGKIISHYKVLEKIGHAKRTHNRSTVTLTWMLSRGQKGSAC